MTLEKRDSIASILYLASRRQDMDVEQQVVAFRSNHKSGVEPGHVQLEDVRIGSNLRRCVDVPKPIRHGVVFLVADTCRSPIVYIVVPREPTIFGGSVKSP
ncbi:MAG: hypothetical protein CMJ78_24580 [Planctomycetaceae bacterium]|nr:hypothetical protein [Planctomycetaceae bacterium]